MLLDADTWHQAFGDVREAEAVDADASSSTAAGVVRVCPITALGEIVDPTTAADLPGDFPRDLIRELGYRTRYNRPYLPVGAAIRKGPIIAVPVRYVEHAVRRTRNAYHAFTAALCLAARDDDVRYLRCPALCTDPRCALTIAASAAQMRQAYDEFVRGARPIDEGTDAAAFVASREHLDEQPRTIDMLEFKFIRLADIERARD